MVVVGADVHKHTHTFVAVDEVGRKIGAIDVRRRPPKGTPGVARGPGRRSEHEVVWAIEDCRHLSARLERDLLTAGQKVVRVPPKMMAMTRASRPHPGQVRSDRCVGGGAGVPAANPTCR